MDDRQMACMHACQVAIMCDPMIAITRSQEIMDKCGTQWSLTSKYPKYRMPKLENSLHMWAYSCGTMFILLYVDNLIIRGEHLTNIKKVKSLLIVKFEMKNMEELQYFLGFEMTHNCGILL